MSRTCSQRCGAACFLCAQGAGDACASFGRKMSPSSAVAAKRCGICSTITLLFAIGFIVQAFLVPPLLNHDLANGLKKAVLLNDPSSQQFKNWADNSQNPLILSAYVYNILNADDIVNGAKPIIVEMGPYVYKQYTLNYNTTYGDDTNSTLYFRTYTSYEFVREMSVGDEMENITTINMPFVSMRAFYEIENDYRALYSLFTMFPGKYKDSTEAQRLFCNTTIHEAFFGWEDPILSLLNIKYRGFFKNYDNYYDAVHDPQNDFFWNQIYTGVNGTALKDRDYLMWHNQSYIATCPFPHATDYCDISEDIPAWNNGTNGPPMPGTLQPTRVAELRGNDGSVFPTPLNGQSVLTTFFFPFMRSMDLVYKQPSEYKGVPLLQFGFSETTFLNSQSYPFNAAFYQNGPNGLLNMTNVQGNIPIYVSQPRFASSDPSLSEAIFPFYLGPADINSVPQTIFEVEPESGVTFHVKTASQVNIFVSPLSFPLPSPDDVTWFKNMESLYFPVVWAVEEGGIDNSDATVIKDVLFLIALSQIGGLVIGVFLALLSFLYFFLSWRAYELENTRHLAAVRSLIASSNEEDSAATGGRGGSLLDSSVLLMQDDAPDNRYGAMPNKTPKNKKKEVEPEGVDISYRDDVTPKHGSTGSGSYQQI